MTPEGQLETWTATDPLPHSARWMRASWIESRTGRTVALLVVLALATGVPLVLAIVTGSIGIPHNDAWSHAKIAEEFGRTGVIQLVGWNRTALVGQVVPLGPLASSIIAQHLFVAALSLVALVATYAYLVRKVVPSAALLGTLIVGIAPEFGLLATSFMSDIPAFAALMLCLVLTDQALRTQKPLYLAFALLAGVWGVTIREQDIVGPVVALAVTSLAWRGRKRLIALGLGLLAAAAVGVFELWRRSLPYGDSPVFEPDVLAAARVVVLAAFTIALYVAPAVFSVARPTQWSVRTRWLSAISLIPTLAIAIEAYPVVFLPNCLDPSGAYSAASVGARVDVIPSWLWLGLVLLACVSLCLIIGLVLDKRFRIDRTSALVGALFIAGTIAQAAAGQAIFSRYLLPLLPIACAVILKGHVLRRRRFMIPALTCLAVVWLGITANALSFDAARWQAASTLQQRGIAATDINAGLEWVGYHAAEPAEQGRARRGVMTWYMSMFQKSRECYVISASQLGGRSPIDIYEYRTYGLSGVSQLWIYQGTGCR